MKRLKTIVAGTMTLALTLGGGLLAHQQYVRAADNETSPTVQQQDDQTQSQPQNRMRGKAPGQKPAADGSAAQGHQDGKRGFPGGGHGFAFGGGIGISDELAALLGTTKDELRSAIQSGSTIASIAETKGVSLDSVVSLLVSSQAERLDQQVADGKLTQEQADQRKTQLTEAATRFVNGELNVKGGKVRQERSEGEGKADGKVGFPGGHGFAFGGGIGISDELAALLGTTKDELRSAIQSGSTIASIASAKGVSLDSVVSLLVSSQGERLDQQVTDGKLTQEQADQRKTQLTEAATRFVNGELNLKGGKDGQAREDGKNRGKAQFPGGHGLAFGGGIGISDELAALLGTTKDELRSAIQSGSTIASIAETKGVSLDSVVSLLVSSQVERLDQQIADGKLTQEQADQRKTQLTEAATRFVNGELNLKGDKDGQARDGSKGKTRLKGSFPGERSQPTAEQTT